MPDEKQCQSKVLTLFWIFLQDNLIVPSCLCSSSLVKAGQIVIHCETSKMTIKAKAALAEAIFWIKGIVLRWMVPATLF